MPRMGKRPLLPIGYQSGGRAVSLRLLSIPLREDPVKGIRPRGGDGPGRGGRRRRTQGGTSALQDSRPRQGSRCAAGGRPRRADEACRGRGVNSPMSRSAPPPPVRHSFADFAQAGEKKPSQGPRRFALPNANCPALSASPNRKREGQAGEVSERRLPGSGVFPGVTVTLALGLCRGVGLAPGAHLAGRPPPLGPLFLLPESGRVVGPRLQP